MRRFWKNHDFSRLIKNRMKFLAGTESRFFDFIGNLSDKDKVAILSHNDLDGVASAVIAGKVIGKIDYLKFLGYEPGLYTKIIAELKKSKINKIICLDLVIDNSDADIKEVEKFAEILIIDHHPIFKNIESERTVFLKTDTSSAAYACYYLFSQAQQLPSWIAALGIIGDNPQVYNESNAEQVFEDFRLGKKINLFKNARDVELAILKLGKEKLPELFQIIMNSKYPSDLNVLSKYSLPMEKELEMYTKKFDKEKEVYGDLIVFYYETKIKINPVFTNDISLRFPNKTVVLIQNKQGEKYLNISSRRQDRKLDCNELMKRVFADIPNSAAGGHKSAAGGQILPGFLAKFKENLIKAHSEMIK